MIADIKAGPLSMTAVIAPGASAVGNDDRRHRTRRAAVGSAPRDRARRHTLQAHAKHALTSG
jgi:hypothetical protein